MDFDSNGYRKVKKIRKNNDVNQSDDDEAVALVHKSTTGTGNDHATAQRPNHKSAQWNPSVRQSGEFVAPPPEEVELDQNIYSLRRYLKQSDDEESDLELLGSSTSVNRSNLPLTHTHACRKQPHSQYRPAKSGSNSDSSSKELRTCGSQTCLDRNISPSNSNITGITSVQSASGISPTSLDSSANNQESEFSSAEDTFPRSHKGDRSRKHHPVGSSSESSKMFNRLPPSGKEVNGRHAPQHDFLNIPPPSHPPEASPTTTPQGQRPLPPNRTLPAVPVNFSDTDSIVSRTTSTGRQRYLVNGNQLSLDEAHYEDPQLLPSDREETPPVVLPRVSLLNRPSGTGSNRNLVPAAFVPPGFREPQIPSWDGFQPRILERTENGNFFIPSSETNTLTSSLSPQRKTDSLQREIARANNAKMNSLSRHNNNAPNQPLPPSFGFAPAGYRNQDHSDSSTVSHRYLAKNGHAASYTSGHLTSSSTPRSPRGPFSWQRCCSWRRLAYCLAAVLLLSIAVISYLVVSLLTTPVSDGSNQGLGHAAPTTVGGRQAPLGPLKPTVVPQRPLPDMFPLGDEIYADLAPGLTYSSFILTQPSAQVRFNWTVDAQTKLAIYARRTLKPTATEHDYVRIVLGQRLNSAVVKRSTAYSYGTNMNFRKTSFELPLQKGLWYVGIFNDNDRIQGVRFVGEVADDDFPANSCKYNCYGKGVCIHGKCVCNEGYGGTYCRDPVCPVLCSGYGIFNGGRCHCHQGWKGTECDIPFNQCEDPLCGNNGECGAEGSCNCRDGYTGPTCSERTCRDPVCSNHGTCVNGKCYCNIGFGGEVCGQKYIKDTSLGVQTDLVCGLNEKKVHACNSHGSIVQTSPIVCRCEPNYEGPRCEYQKCDLSCGNHGRCRNWQCHCDDGYHGAKCELKACLPGCEDHGACNSDYGTCRCFEGWNGENCWLEGCPSKCNGPSNGNCEQNNGGHWHCSCTNGYSGVDCSGRNEVNCSDNIDNDGDGLVDCMDSDCNSHRTCSTYKLHAKPLNVLWRVEETSSKDSFFDRYRFLVEEKGNADSPSQMNFDGIDSAAERQMSIVYGWITEYGTSTALSQVRVFTASNNPMGYVISRPPDGKFEFVIQGCRSVDLSFSYPPKFVTERINLWVPCNRHVHLNVTLRRKFDTALPSHVSVPELTTDCAMVHDYARMKPYIVPSWQLNLHGVPEGRFGILAMARSFQESIPIPGSDLRLTYSSTHSPGFDSFLLISLIPATVPEKLRLVKLRIDVAGFNFVKSFSATANLTYQFTWNKKGIFSIPAYGITKARVSVRYIYADCSHEFESVSDVDMKATIAEMSELGGWNLNVHHRLDPIAKLLTFGDGSSWNLNQNPFIVESVLGSSQQRTINCFPCNYGSESYSLYKIIGLAALSNGKVFVGDYNLIRLFDPTTKDLRTLVELDHKFFQVPYGMAVDPLSDDLIISVPLERKLYRLYFMEPDGSLRQNMANDVNMVVFAGTDDTCSVGENCGDGGPANMAKFNYPKGLAFNDKGDLFVADGQVIRMIRPSKTDDASWSISTFIGNSSPDENEWSNADCYGEISLDRFQPQWPTQMTTDPVTHRLYFADADVIYEVANEKMLRIVAGLPAHCNSLKSRFNATSGHERVYSKLHHVKSLSFTLAGHLLVAESDGKVTNYIREIDLLSESSEGTIIAGQSSGCVCHLQNCPCDNQEPNGQPVLASKSKFFVPTAMTVSPFGIVFIADRENNKIKALYRSVPELKNKKYQINLPERQEQYEFDGIGRHLKTIDLVSGKVILKFVYESKSDGKLVKITGAGNQQINIDRTSDRKITITNIVSQKIVLNTVTDSSLVLLKEVVMPSGDSVVIDYDIHQRLVAINDATVGTARYYEYLGKDSGLLKSYTSQTGSTQTIDVALSGRKVIATVKNGEKVKKLTWEPNKITFDNDHGIGEIVQLSDGSFEILNDFGIVRKVDSSWNSIASNTHSRLVHQKLEIPSISLMESTPSDLDKISQKFTWSHFAKTSDSGERTLQVAKTAQVNGANALTIQWDMTKEEDIFNDGRVKPNTLFRVEYDPSGNPITVTPKAVLKGKVAKMMLKYHFSGSVEEILWDKFTLKNELNSFGRVISENKMGVVRKYNYSGSHLMPSSVLVAQNETYTIERSQFGDHVSAVTTPNGLKYELNQLNDIDRNVKLVKLPNENYVIAEYDQFGSVITVRDASGNNVILGYSANQMTEKKSEYEMTTVEHFGKVKEIRTTQSVEAKKSFFGMTKKLQYNGPFLLNVSDARHFNGGPSQIAKLQYRLDQNFRLSWFQIGIEDHIKSIKVEHDGMGQLEAYGDYKFVREMEMGRVTISKKHFVRKTYLSQNHMVEKEVYSIRGIKVAEMEVTIGDKLDISEWRLNRDMQDEFVQSYSYDENRRLVSVTTGDISEKFTYSIDGQLSAINDVSFTIDKTTGYVTSADKNVIEYDENGFMISRGNIDFKYDSLGRMVLAEESGVFKNEYGYDENNRLIAVFDRISNEGFYFYYSNSIQPDLISHIYNVKTGMTSMLIYDDMQRLFAVHVYSDKYVVLTVLTKPDGSPVRIYNSIDGDLEQTLAYSAYGELSTDVELNCYLPIGFRGSYHDRKAGVVFIRKSNGLRPYDPTTGQWMSYDVIRDVIDAFDVMHPDATFPVNKFSLGSRISVPSSVGDWLEMVGYRLEGLIPALSTSRAVVGKSGCFSDNTDVVFGAQCRYVSLMKSFDRMQTLQRSPVQSNLKPPPAKFAPVSNALGNSVLLKRTDSNSIVPIFISTMSNNIRHDLKSFLEQTFTDTVLVNDAPLWINNLRSLYVLSKDRNDNSAHASTPAFSDVKITRSKQTEYEEVCFSSKHSKVCVWEGVTSERARTLFNEQYKSVLFH